MGRTVVSLVHKVAANPDDGFTARLCAATVAGYNVGFNAPKLL